MDVLIKHIQTETVSYIPLLFLFLSLLSLLY
jgi:hypothetical protein